MACSALGGITGGSGPVYNTSGSYTATYTCYSGYTMIGSDTLTCSSGAWSSNPPECINDKYYNDIDLNDSGVPTWLAILLGIVAGLMALVLLTCLLICCLRLCGCLPGSFFGGSHVYPDDAAYGGCCYCCRKRETYRRRRRGRITHGRGYDSRSSSLVDLEDGPYIVSTDNGKYNRSKNTSQSTVIHPDRNGNPHVPNGRPPQNHEKQATLVRSNIVHTSTESGFSSSKNADSPRFANSDDVIVNSKYQKEAKVIKQWMPHSNPVRTINTSTK